MTYVLRQCTALLLITTAVMLFPGCSPTVQTVYPADEQSDEVTRSTRSGYDYLVSSKDDVQVTVSLRAATPDAAQFYMSVANRSDNAINVDPSDVKVTMILADGSQKTMTAYAPDEAPGFLRRKAMENQQEAVSLGRTNIVGASFSQVSESSIQAAIINPQDREVGGRKGYGTSAQAGASQGMSIKNLLFQPEVLSPNTVTDGMVISDMQDNVERIILNVPIRDKMHSFKYYLKVEEK